jgi:hypothetical protein
MGPAVGLRKKGYADQSANRDEKDAFLHVMHRMIVSGSDYERTTRAG